ncbi:MAG: DUF423 domain-containing protein [Candidatus Marinamargulisbacteria bacterium]
MNTGVFSVVYCAISIILGAYFQHGLDHGVTMEQKVSLSVATRYLFYVGIIGLIIFFSKPQWEWSNKNLILILVSGGIFSFSIIGLVLFNLKFLGPLTPIGGIGIIIGLLIWARLIAKHGRSN